MYNPPKSNSPVWQIAMILPYQKPLKYKDS